MKWKIKSAAYRVLENLPAGDETYYFFQRYVTRSLPRAPARMRQYVINTCRHIESFRDQGLALDNGLLLSVGAGWDLLENLIFYGYGLNNQIAIDVRPLARIALINEMAAYLGKNPLDDQKPRPFPALGKDLKGDLRRLYGIDYRAPSDARAVTLPDCSVDMIVINVAIQHIPRHVIVSILKEFRRLIVPCGALSIDVNYSDQFQHSDPSITVYNFLRFSEDEWRRHNPDWHHQNRLRHSDYVHLFEEAGFQIVKEIKEAPPTDWKRLLERQPIAHEFQHYPPEELAVLKGYFLLVPTVRQ